jgi:sugar lactone lactonase YvrE
MIGIRWGIAVLAIMALHRPAAAEAPAVEVVVEGDAVGDPFGVEIGPDGGLYFTDIRTHRVLRVDLATRQMTPVVGAGRRGYGGDGGPALEAEMDEPYEVRFDGDGHMYVVEMRNHLVRRIDAKSKLISTIAGTGQQGFSGDGGPAAAAKLSQPHSIALDGDGGLLIADIGNQRIRRVDLKSGLIETVAGDGRRIMPVDGQPAEGRPLLGPRALFANDGTLWIALREGHSVWRMQLGHGLLHHVAGAGTPGYSGDGRAAKTAELNGPKGIALDGQENVLLVDSANNALRSIDPRADAIATIAGGSLDDAALAQPHGVCIGPDGAIYVGDTLNHRILKVKR